MSELDVRIIKLETIRVASFLGYGKSPEDIAFNELLTWAKPRGLLEDREKHRIFGFNNPCPSPGSPNYGYEVWIVVDDKAEFEDGVEIKTITGGRYAVTRCVVPKGQFEVITDTWKKLVTWREDSKYRCGHQQCLEESLPIELPDTEFVLDLYLSIAE